MAEPQRDLVFISYSHLDKKWLSDLLTFLKPYQRKGMAVWADPYIKVGSRWERDINQALSRACVGVLLVSQEFLASDFIYESELPPLTSAADRGDLTLVCVPVSSFTFDASDLDEYQWARDPQQPLAAARGNSRRRALVEITNAIVEAAGNCSEPSVETTKASMSVPGDVWQPAHAQVLDVIGPVGRLVVTTRDSSVVTALGAEELALDALSPEASLELLAQWSGTDRESLPPQAAELAEACGRLPLALTLAGAQVRDGRSWPDLMAALQAGRLDYLDHPYGSVFSSMHLSLDALEETQRARLLELAVFPEDLPIPEATILRYWSQTGGVADYEARALLQAFKNKGLLYLRQDNNDTPVVELHELQRDFLLLLVDDPEPMHEALLQAHATAYRQDADDWAWWRMPASEPYLWDWLGLHLRETGRPDEFRRLLFDYRWLKAKLQVRGFNHLLTDYDGFPSRDDAGLVRSALELLAHVLTQAPGQLAPQLLGRLMGLDRPELQGLCESIRQFETGC